jgi:cell wall-associated NlpC family hydrolase
MNTLQRGQATLISVALLVFLLSPEAEAKTRQRKRTAFSVALQPFSLVHSAVQAVAAPVLDQGPRVLRAVATAPIRAAYYKQRRVRPRVPPAVPHYEQSAEGDGQSQPIRVAYQSARRMPERGPEAESGDDYDQERDQDQEREQDAESSPQVERRGDRPTVSGKRAVLRNGIAYAPSRAPESVKQAIWAANTLRRKPYVWGGGHGSFSDRGYDCSGSVSYALHGAGVLAAPLPSSDLMRYGDRGRGRWITVYSRPGHTFAVIAGLRFDTTDLGRGGDVGPRWYADGRDTRGFVARHPTGF